MHPYLYPYVIAPVFISWYLQGLSSQTDTVVRTYNPLMLFAQDVIQICPHPWDKRCPLFECRMHKFRIAGRHIYLSKIAVGFFHVSYLMIGKFFGKTPLMCPKCPLTASPGFRRIGRYHLYTKMPHCPAKLGRIVLVYLPSCLRSMPIVASTICIERTE